jgi:ABC-type uncharacterized transport system ATPase subunit
MSTHAQDVPSPKTTGSGGGGSRHQRTEQAYGASIAVDDLAFSLRARTVTGFLGPNG